MTCAILIVEDDPELHELYAAMLEQSDCCIVRAHDGLEAWQAVRDDPRPDPVRYHPG